MQGCDSPRSLFLHGRVVAVWKRIKGQDIVIIHPVGACGDIRLNQPTNSGNPATSNFHSELHRISSNILSCSLQEFYPKSKCASLQVSTRPITEIKAQVRGIEVISFIFACKPIASFISRNDISHLALIELISFPLLNVAYCWTSLRSNRKSLESFLAESR